MGAMEQEITSILSLMTNVITHTIAGRQYHQGLLNARPVVLVFSRWGKVAAASTITTLITHFKCDFVVFTGVAGAASEKLNVGDIVIADTLCQHDMDARPLFPRFEIPLIGQSLFTPNEPECILALTATRNFLHSIKDKIQASSLKEFNIMTPQVYLGLIATGDQFISDINSHAALQALKPHNLMAVEMEGAAVAQVCQEHQIPYIIFRTISDKADRSAAIDFTKFIEHIACYYARFFIIELFNLLDSSGYIGEKNHIPSKESISI